MHAAVASFVAQAIEHKDRNHGGPFRSVLEIGGRNVNGGVRSLFGPAPYESVDLVDGPDVTLIHDFTDPGLRLAQFDCVVCTNVLEHVEDWKAIVSNVYDSLISGGWFIVTVPSDPFPAHSGIDGLALRPGEWYRNVNGLELIDAVSDACFELEMAVCVPPDSMVVGVKR